MNDDEYLDASVALAADTLTAFHWLRNMVNARAYDATSTLQLQLTPHVHSVESLASYTKSCIRQEISIN
jgi:hypothetical protein